MSTTIAKNYQVGSDSTATNNFTIRQPATPDGTVRIANGNSGTTTDLVTVTSAGNVGVGTTSPGAKLDVQGGRSYFASNSDAFAAYLRYNNSTAGVFLGSPSANAFQISNSGGGSYLNIDSSGNLGLGATPSAYNSRGFDISSFVGLSQNSAGAAVLAFNNFQNAAGNYIYKTTNAAARYDCGASGTSAHAWYSAASGTAGNTISFTQAMTLDTSGNLGIGTTSPGQKLTVGANGVFRLQTGSVTMDCTPTPGATDGFVWNVSAGYYDWSIGGTSRVRITSGGNFGLGTSTPAFKMQVAANANTYSAVFQNANASPYGIYVNHNGASPNNAGNEFMICWDTTAIRFRLDSNGGIENYQANNVNLSDRREKTNFAPAKSYLDTICAIPVQTFNYADQNLEEDPGLTLGVVAQDVQAVAPELVVESNWGTKEDPKMRLSIYQTDLQYALMKCIQELKAELDSVKTELALLKGTA